MRRNGGAGPIDGSLRPRQHVAARQTSASSSPEDDSSLDEVRAARPQRISEPVTDTSEWQKKYSKAKASFKEKEKKWLEEKVRLQMEIKARDMVGKERPVTKLSKAEKAVVVRAARKLASGVKLSGEDVLWAIHEREAIYTKILSEMNLPKCQLTRYYTVLYRELQKEISNKRSEDERKMRKWYKRKWWRIE